MLKNSYSELEYQFLHLVNSLLPYVLKGPRKHKTLLVQLQAYGKPNTGEAGRLEVWERPAFGSTKCPSSIKLNPTQFSLPHTSAEGMNKISLISETAQWHLLLLSVPSIHLPPSSSLPPSGVGPLDRFKAKFALLPISKAVLSRGKMWTGERLVSQRSFVLTYHS